MTATDPVRETVNAVYLSDSRRVLATLIGLLGDFDAAEEALLGVARFCRALQGDRRQTPAGSLRRAR